ncbi:MAG: hypothetical protein L3J20_10735 [Flavobacteriaceae bacterium]|nr:hypothetical protein [Flavobacteriaceae bacterium]
MKRLLYIFVVLLITSCAKSRKEVPIESVEMDKTETVLESAAIEDAKEMFTYQHLTEQKLQDYYDLLVLQQQHPEFVEDITTQLHELSNDSIIISDLIQKVNIENVQQIGEIQQISDSIQKIKLRFDIIANNSVKKDSITAIIKTKKISLDNEELISTKVVFTKEKISN